ncbi:MAG: GerMN domain-containing protein [Clostridiaceae bacterium]|nr:GerMN domain-containing protein [Clostridiaceae bacterium]
MKNFLCFLLITGVVLISGCKNPLSELDNIQTRIDNIETLKEQDLIDVSDATEVSENSKDAKKDEIDRDVVSKVAKEDKPKTKEQVSDQNSSSDKTANEILTITAYYKDSENVLIPVTRKIEKEEGVAKAAIKTMIENETNREALRPLGLKPVLPEGTEILGINIENGIAIIDFNSKLLGYSTARDENNIITSIVYSLTEFETINAVRILINGYVKEELKYSGDISGTLKRDNILINSDKLNTDSKTMKLDVYLFKYLENKHEKLLPVSMEYIGVSKDKLPMEIVGSLSKEPKDPNLYTQMPENARLLDSSISDEVLTLNFSKEIKNYGGNSREEGLIKQILYTMKQINGIKKIRILIEGKKDDLPEGTDISKPLLIPDKINKVN